MSASWQISLNRTISTKLKPYPSNTKEIPMNHSAHTSTATAQHPASRPPLSQPAAPPRTGTRWLVSVLAVLTMLAASLVAVLVATSSPAAAQSNSTLIFHNTTQTSSSHANNNQRTIVLTIKNASNRSGTCAGSNVVNADGTDNVVEVGPSAMATVTVRKSASCRFRVFFKNKSNDCNVTMTYSAGGRSVTRDSFNFVAGVDLRGQSNGISYENAGSTGTASHTQTIMVEDGTACTKTTFNPEVSGTAPTGTDFNNKMFKLVYTAHKNNLNQANRDNPDLDNGVQCSRGVQQTVTINNGMLSATSVNLVGNVWGKVDCKYNVAMRAADLPDTLQYLPSRDVRFVDRTLQEVVSDTLVRNFPFQRHTEVTAANKAISVTLQKLGTLTFRNITAKATEGTMAEKMAADALNAITVNLTKPSSCQAPTVPTVDGSPIAVGGMATVFLVANSCDWDFNFVGGSTMCTFEYRPKELNGRDLRGAEKKRALTLTSVDKDSSTEDPKKLSLVLKDETDPAKQVRIIDLNVTGCFTTFTPTINLTVEDTLPGKMASDHNGAQITASISKAANAHAGCSDDTTVDLTITDNAATGSTASPLVNLPAGGTVDTDECDYDVTFTDEVEASFAKLVESNTPPTVTLNATNHTVTRTYNATAYGSGDLWTLTVENDTAANSAGHADADQRTVRLTFKRAGTTAGCNGASVLGRNGANNQDDIAPASSAMYTFRKSADCKVTLNFANKSGDCRVNYTDPESGSSTTLNSTQNNDVSIAASATGLTHASGTEATSLTLEMTVGECAKSFTPQPSVTITETTGAPTNAHDNETITVTYTRVSDQGVLSGCTARATQVLTITSRMTSAAALTLVDVPRGGMDGTNDCTYNVSFESPVTSGNLTLVDTGTGTPTVSAALPSVSRTYNSVGDSVAFRNTASSGGAANGINVTIDMGCPGTPPSIANPIATGGSASVRLGGRLCDWRFGATQVGDATKAAGNCLVSLQPKNASGGTVGSAVEEGSILTLTGTVNSGVTRGSFTDKVVSVDMSLVKCSTAFTPAVTVNVTESRQGKTVAVHNGTKITVTYTPTSIAGALANCSGTLQAGVTDELTLNSSGTATGGPELVDVPKGGTDGTNDCSYRVSFGSAASDGATLVDAGTGTPTVSQGSATLTRAYGVVTDSVTFRNTGGRRAGINMRVTRGSGCPTSTAIPTISSPIAFNSSTRARLGMATCAWNIMATSADETCVVSLQPKSAGGSNVGTVVVDDTLVLNGTAGSGVTRTGFTDKVVWVDLSVVRCRSIFTPYVSVSVTDTLTGAAIGDHNGVVIRASLSPVSTTGALSECTSGASVNLTIANRAASGSPSAVMVDLPKGGTSNCQYRVSFPSSLRSGSKVLRLATVGQLTVSAASPRASAAYTAEEVPVVPVTLTVGVRSAPSVDEGQPLVFPVSLSLRASQEVVVNYTVGAVSDSVKIDAGQLAAEISVPTDNDDLDEANQTVRVTLTSATGGASIDPAGRTATGIVKDEDPSPTVGIEAAAIDGNRLRVTLALSEESGRDVRVRYVTSIGVNGTALIKAGQQKSNISQVFNIEALAEVDSVRLSLPSAQNATIDVSNRERLIFPGGGGWQFQVVASSTTAAEIARGLGLGDNWQLYSWSTASQRWVEHSAASRGSAALAAGVAITYRGAAAGAAELTAAGLGRSNDVTLRPGWNIFTPAQGALGLTRGDFTSAAGGGSAVVFDPVLVNCEDTAGALVIYTYDQIDPQAANGFRLALPCHQQALASSGIPAITSIDERDTFYVWFRNDATVELSFANGRYSPAT